MNAFSIFTGSAEARHFDRPPPGLYQCFRRQCCWSLDLKPGLSGWCSWWRYMRYR